MCFCSPELLDIDIFNVLLLKEGYNKHFVQNDLLECPPGRWELREAQVSGTRDKGGKGEEGGCSQWLWSRETVS